MKRRAALLLIGGGLFVGAAWLLRARRPADPAPVVAYTEAGQRQARAGQLTESVISFNRAIAMAPAQPEPYIGLAVLYESIDRPDLAVETLEQLQAANPNAPHLYCRLAEAHLGVEDMRAAKTLGETAVAREPDCARAQSVYGLAMLSYRYWDTAAAHLQQAMRLAPDDVEIGQSLLDVYLQQAQYGKATELGKQLVRQAPDSARLHYQLGWGYSRVTGDREANSEAVRHLQRAIELAPQWFEPRAELGRLYKSLGQNEAAQASFERAWSLNSTAPGVAYNLAALWRQRRDPRADAMEAAYRRLLSGKERFTKMRLYARSGEENVPNSLALADAEARNGMYGVALYRLHRLLVADPANVEALRLYVRLDTGVRARYPNYLRPGPGIAPPGS